MTLVHDLLDLPERVRKGDFVQSLASGIEHPKETVKSYAITPAIVTTFEHSLSVVDSALKTGRSQAAYLHGSFGSGKSHFMAVLYLMLADHKVPWARGELHSLKPKFDWIGQKKLLQLPMHFLGATSVEDKIFDTYVHWTEQHHPDAPIPALYADLELFDNAVALRADLGDTRFFDKLNGGRSMAKGWGSMAKAARWDAARFEATVAGRDNDERGKLFSDLIKSHFPAFTRQTSRFIELDRGLAVLARHAQTLGYDGIVLYLDELILWLASNASDLRLIERETQKLVKLKEGEHDSRAIPIVSLIARQRDLAQLVGDRAQGAERAALEDNLKHNQGRFETVVLADSNLPAIVEHRVLQLRDDNAREILHDASAKAWRAAGMARATLLGSAGDETAFRKVYPFSPALIESLVALSDCLQRERTAIRILMELLVEHLPQLELGPIVPVGDAFDVIAGGEDPFDQAMRNRFARARHLYSDSFLPMIRTEHGTETEAKCQRLREDFPKKLGCSGCTQRACRDDNRLAKTLLMAALVPGAATFQGLTVKKLVHLNHGTVTSPIPGAEVQLTAEKLRRWDAQVGPLRVGAQNDPEITLHLEGIDLKPIIDKARGFDSHGARRNTLRKLLFGALSLPTDLTVVEGQTVEFKGVRRKGTVRFGNVRELSDAQLRCPSNAEWYLILDYPFDVGGSPEDDLNRVDEFRDAHGADEEPTLVWLPTFFSHKMEQTLGDYVTIDHILDGRVQEYLGHLRTEDQLKARSDLVSLKDQKRDQILSALKAAYGLTPATDNPALDLSRKVEDHVLALAPSLHVGALLAGTLEDGMRQVVTRLIDHRFPHHPGFGATVTTGKLDRVRLLVERLLETPTRRMPVTTQDRHELQRFADPLGLTQTTEAATMLQERTFTDLDQRRQQAGVEDPRVADVRSYTDPDGYRGLTQEMQDLLVWTYALWAGRSVVHMDREVELRKLGQLPDDAELIRPELPSDVDWQAALDKAAELFGITFANRHLNARNLSSFCERLSKAAADGRSAPALQLALESALDEWADREGAPRLTTAVSAANLIALIEQSERAERVRRLAGFTPETSATAVSRSLTTTPDVLAALRQEARWLNFHSVRGLLSDPTKQERARQILEDLDEALRSDELNKPLCAALAELTRRAGELLKKKKKGPNPWRHVAVETCTVQGATGYAAALAALAQTMELAAAEAQDGELKLEVTAVLSGRHKVER